MAELRLKFGRNTYTATFQCAYCRESFKSNGKGDSLFVRLEIKGIILDFPICPTCLQKHGLFETTEIDVTQHNTSHEIGLA